jgi:hypothetical protein
LRQIDKFIAVPGPAGDHQLAEQAGVQDERPSLAPGVALRHGLGRRAVGLATGLITTSQQVAVTVRIPALGAVMAVRSDLLAGIHLALTANVLLTLTAVVVIRAGLNRQGWRMVRD